MIVKNTITNVTNATTNEPTNTPVPEAAGVGSHTTLVVPVTRALLERDGRGRADNAAPDEFSFAETSSSALDAAARFALPFAFAGSDTGAGATRFPQL
jgi:hypothetical protein